MSVPKNLQPMQTNKLEAIAKIGACYSTQSKQALPGLGLNYCHFERGVMLFAVFRHKITAKRLKFAASNAVRLVTFRNSAHFRREFIKVLTFSAL